MKIAFCIGNGESRTGLDLDQFKQYGTLYGANAVYRDTEVDHLVCCDKRMVNESLHNNYKGTVYTRPDWYNQFATPQVRCLPSFRWPESSKWTKHFHWGSGLHAVYLACKQGASICVMIGHDFYSIDGKHNNIYKDKRKSNAVVGNYCHIHPSVIMDVDGMKAVICPKGNKIHFIHTGHVMIGERCSIGRPRIFSDKYISVTCSIRHTCTMSHKGIAGPSIGCTRS